MHCSLHKTRQSPGRPLSALAIRGSPFFIALAAAGLLGSSACATAEMPPAASLDSRVKLTALPCDSWLARRPPVATKAPETPRADDKYAIHLAWLADQKVEIAGARREMQTPRADADSAGADAASASDAVAASRAARLALHQQLTVLDGHETDRGLVVAPGDLVFATGKSDLTGRARRTLDELAALLGKSGDRTVLIEGHTDSVGSEESNRFLSQRRAESVESYLVSRRVQANRLTAAGRGQGSPVASNDTATGRQQNRRIEVFISNATTPSSAAGFSTHAPGQPGMNPVGFFFPTITTRR